MEQPIFEYNFDGKTHSIRLGEHGIQVDDATIESPKHFGWVLEILANKYTNSYQKLADSLELSLELLKGRQN